VSKGVIFQELCAIGGDIMQLITFVCAFYAFDSPMFFNHHNHEGDVIVIPSTMGTLGGALFALAHFKALHFTVNHFSSCLFPSIVDDTHIIGVMDVKIRHHLPIDGIHP